MGPLVGRLGRIVGALYGMRDATEAMRRAGVWIALIFGVAGLAAFADILPGLQSGGALQLEPIFHHGLSALAILAWTPVIERINALRRKAGPCWPRFVALHALSGVGFAAAHISWTLLILLLVTGRHGVEGAVTATSLPVDVTREGLVYALLVAISALLPRAETTAAKTEFCLRLRDNSDIRLVPVRSIEAIEAARNYVVIHAAGREHVERSTLSDIERRLGQVDFVRVNRSVLLAVSALRALTPYGPRDYAVTLKSGRRYRVSRTRIGALRARFERSES